VIRHKKIYLEYFGFKEGDFVPSEISGKPATDIHHIDARGMGGDPQGKKDVIENLMALTREEHEMYGDKVQYVDWLRKIHLEYMKKGKNKYTSPFSLP
jgi:hypothetical protein